MWPMASYAALASTTTTARRTEIYDLNKRKKRGCKQIHAANGVVRTRGLYDAAGREHEILRRERERITTGSRESVAIYTVTIWEGRTLTIWSVTVRAPRLQLDCAVLR